MEKIREKIGYYKVLIPMLWTGVFLTIGSIGWLIKNSFPNKEFFVSLFFLFIMVFVISLFSLNRRVKQLLKEL